MTRPKILLYLHHVELGQRYPISEEVIIGRRTGHILFPKDNRLSIQHCKIFLGADEKLLIQDLESDHGTVVDGRLLSPDKAYPIKDGTTIAVGAQIFKCVEPKHRPKPMRKLPKKYKNSPRPGFPYFTFFLAATMLAVLAMHFNPPLKLQAKAALYQTLIWLAAKTKTTPDAPANPAPIPSPFEIVYQEVEAAYEQYRTLGREVQSGRTKGKPMAAELRQNLIPKFQAAQAKLAVLRPTDDSERRRISANSRLVNSILKQISAMASFAETGNPKYSAIVAQATPEVEAANTEARKANGQRVPAGEN